MKLPSRSKSYIIPEYSLTGDLLSFLTCNTAIRIRGHFLHQNLFKDGLENSFMEFLKKHILNGIQIKKSFHGIGKMISDQ